jgi:hypothetical protein
VSAVQHAAPLKRTTPFAVSSDIPELVRKLAERHVLSGTGFVEKVVASAVRFIVRVQPNDPDKPFIARVRELAAQRPHPRAAVTVGYSVGDAFIDGIRQLQNSLGLPRQGLVVEYLVRAAWDVEGDDGGGNDGDEIERRFRSTSQNLHPLVTSPSDGPEPRKVPHQLRLVLLRGDDPPTS